MRLYYVQVEVTELSEHNYSMLVEIDGYKLWFATDLIRITKAEGQQKEFSVRQLVGEFPRKELLSALMFVADSVHRDLKEYCLQNI